MSVGVALCHQCQSVPSRVTWRHYRRRRELIRRITSCSTSGQARSRSTERGDSSGICHHGLTARCRQTGAQVQGQRVAGGGGGAPRPHRTLPADRGTGTGSEGRWGGGGAPRPHRTLPADRGTGTGSEGRRGGGAPRPHRTLPADRGTGTGSEGRWGGGGGTTASPHAAGRQGHRYRVRWSLGGGGAPRPHRTLPADRHTSIVRGT